MQEINTLAKMLVSLEEEEKIRRVQEKICELVFEHLTDLPVQRKKGNNELTTIRFHLIPGRRFNLEQFNEQLFLSVSKNESGKWRFCPESGAEYLTYLKFIIGKRVNEFDNSGFSWETECQTAHCGRCKPHFIFCELTFPIVPYRDLPQTLRGLTADCRSLV